MGSAQRDNRRTSSESARHDLRSLFARTRLQPVLDALKPQERNRRAPAVDAMRDERSTDDNDAADDLLLSFAPSQAYLSALVARGDRRQLERTLLRGCSSGASDVVEFLLAHGTDPNCVDEDGATALCLATAHRQGECVRLLVEAGADLEATDRNAGWSVPCPS